MAVIGLHEETGVALVGGQRCVGTAQRGQLSGGAILHQARLVQLDPRRAGRGQPLDDLRVDLQDTVQRRAEKIHAVILRLAEQGEGERAHQHRSGRHALGLGLSQLIEGLAGGQVKTLAAVPLGDDVVVVGVEPLGHLHGRDVEPGALGAASHGKVGVQVDGPAIPVVARGHGADEGHGVEHRVIE